MDVTNITDDHDNIAPTICTDNDIIVPTIFFTMPCGL